MGWPPTARTTGRPRGRTTRASSWAGWSRCSRPPATALLWYRRRPSPMPPCRSWSLLAASSPTRASLTAVTTAPSSRACSCATWPASRKWRPTRAIASSSSATPTRSASVPPVTSTRSDSCGTPRSTARIRSGRARGSTPWSPRSGSSASRSSLHLDRAGVDPEAGRHAVGGPVLVDQIQIGGQECADEEVVEKLCLGDDAVVVDVHAGGVDQGAGLQALRHELRQRSGDDRREVAAGREADEAEQLAVQRLARLHTNRDTVDPGDRPVAEHVGQEGGGYPPATAVGRDAVEVGV